MNQAVHEGRPQLAPPFNHLPGMVLRSRLDARRTLLFAGEGARRVTGYDPAELVENAVVAYGDLIYEHDQEMVEETISRALRERRSFQMSYRIHTRVGEEKWVWEQGSGVFPEDDGEIVLESIVVDVTPRRMAAARQGQERRGKGAQPAAGVAHDFKNIMSIIVLYSELLERQPQHPRRNHYLSVITKQAQQAAHLIGQLLDYSRSFPHKRVDLELNLFLTEIADLLEQALPGNIHLIIDSSVPEVVVAADTTRLQQVLLNLVLNARDAMPDGGTLGIALSEFKPSPTGEWPVAFSRQAWSSDLAEEKWIQIEVQDSGTGIAPDVLPHIFKPFFTTKQGSGGTGLGLVQVDGIVEQLGGTVGVDSRVGEGSTFTVYLPVVELDTSGSGKPQRQGSVDKPQQRILVVEDDALAREALVEAVRSFGYEVVTADSGWEALQLFDMRKRAIDLLLIAAPPKDMQVGELIRYIRRRKGDIPCLLVNYSGQDRQSVEELVGENIFWIQKPFSLQTVAWNLRLALDQ